MFHDPATFANGFPHETFHELRANDPVSHHDHPTWKRGYWVIADHADVQRVSRDASTFSNAPHPFLDGELAEDDDAGMSELLISQDPPIHTKLRKIINKGFTPRRVAELEDKVRTRVDSIVDALADSDSCDLVTDIALWLPLHVIADLVGVPEDDREQVFRWTELTFGFDESVTPDERAAAATEMFMYADGLCEQRRAEPRDDLLSVLITAEVEGESLTQMQIDLFFMLLQNAGSETTRNLITTGLIVLLEHPDQLAQLRADPALMPAAIEELLRWVSPVMQFTRRATTDTEIAGRSIAAGERVVLVYPSANRDELAFENPDELDLTRQPNDHVAFGAGGPHFCLGANLARFEARIMFDALLHRFDGLEVTTPVDTLPRVHSNLIDGYSHVPIRWDAVRAERIIGVTAEVIVRPLSATQAATRHRLLDAARELATEGGYEAVGMRQVAARAGLSAPTAYLYFSSKDHLLVDVLVELVGHTTDTLSTTLSTKPSKSRAPVERAVAMLRRAVQNVEKAPDLYVAVTRAYVCGSSEVAHARSALESSMQQWIDLAIGDTEIPGRAEIVRILEAVMFANMVGLVTGGRAPADIADELERAARTLLAGA